MKRCLACGALMYQSWPADHCAWCRPLWLRNRAESMAREDTPPSGVAERMVADALEHDPWEEW